MPRRSLVALALMAILIAALAVFVGPSLAGRTALAARAISHPVEDRAECLSCHGPDGARPVPANHQGRADSTCQSCHAAPVEVPVEVAEVAQGEPAQPAGTAVADASVPVAGGGCLRCHGVPGVERPLPSGEKVVAYIDPDAFAGSPHAGLPCQTCHADKASYPHPAPAAKDLRAYNAAASSVCKACHAASVETWASNVHGKAYAAGRTDAAVCSDCHQPHASQPVVQAGQSIACASCHQAVVESYEESKHGQLAASGRTDAATCLSCHSPQGRAHDLRPSRQVEAATARQNIADTCGRCHPHSEETYNHTFHGRAMRLGVRGEAPTCIDCHGSFGVGRVHAPEMPLDNAKIAMVCAKCHEGADESFAAGWMGHEEPSPSWFPLVFFTERFLFFLTTAVVGFGVVHVELDLLRWLVNQWQRRRPIGRGNQPVAPTVEAER